MSSGIRIAGRTFSVNTSEEVADQVTSNAEKYTSHFVEVLFFEAHATVSGGP